MTPGKDAGHDRAVARHLERGWDNVELVLGRVWGRLVWLSLRIAFSPCLLSEIQDGRRFYPEFWKPLRLEEAKDLSLLLSTAKEAMDTAADRRKSSSDKAKTLLTVATILTALTGLLMRQVIDRRAGPVEAVLFALVVFCVFNAILLLMVFFGTGRETTLAVLQDDIELDSDNLKKALINNYRQCQADWDARTDFLVDVYRAARAYCLFGLFFLMLGSATAAVLTSESTAPEVVRILRSDPQLIDLLRGPPGRPGLPGEAGATGPPGLDARVDLRDVAVGLASDPAFLAQIKVELDRRNRPVEASRPLKTPDANTD